MILTTSKDAFKVFRTPKTYSCIKQSALIHILSNLTLGSLSDEELSSIQGISDMFKGEPPVVEVDPETDPLFLAKKANKKGDYYPFTHHYHNTLVDTYTLSLKRFISEDGIPEYMIRTAIWGPPYPADAKSEFWKNHAFNTRIVPNSNDIIVRGIL